MSHPFTSPRNKSRKKVNWKKKRKKITWSLPLMVQEVEQGVEIKLGSSETYNMRVVKRILQARSGKVEEFSLN